MTNRRFRECGYPVPFKSRYDVRTRAHATIDYVTARFGRSDRPVPVIALVEYLGSEVKNDCPDYEVIPDDKLPGFAAHFDPAGFIFSVAESVWNLASAGDGWARLIIAHEIGHYALQHPAEAFGRRFDNDIVVKELDSEHQANWFADEYLMDSRVMSDFRSVRDVTNRFQVDRDSAVRRIRDLGREGYWGPSRAK